ncbi:MAG: hypothetical protein EON58_06780 [Alphaproteobacteria bacterium]|nr:MAG: hypothetical protein EON58_06780 [Alphaproteobacteria bacterium]
MVMVLMFGVFSVLFYIDGSTGYRKKNETYYLHKAFQTANDEFSKMNGDGSLTSAAWKEHAAKQNVAFPEDRSVLPADMKLPLPWPLILHDYERMKPLQWNILWREYSKEQGLNAQPPEEPYSAQKIKEQWVVFVICGVLTLVAAFFLLRTIRRSISVDADGVTTQEGKKVPYADLKKLDLRKWDTKGLAFIDFDGAAGKGRIRVDGLTYGGFKKEHDEPAERLMRQIRSRFSGEIIEYTTAPATAPEDEQSKPA